jgi:regulator of protease activity HflC (stomatin/prohibitin superfamily)
VARVLSFALAGIVAVVLLVIVFSAWRSIRPGYVGIVFDKANHNVTTGALDPGWAFINPFTQAIQEYPVTIQTYQMVQNADEGEVHGDDSIKIQSDEGQQINLDVVIQYQVEKDKASQLYVDWGGAPIEQVEDGVVRQYTRSQVPVVAAKYGWEEITSTKRGEIVQEITDVLRTEFDKRHLSLVSFGVREVHLPQALQDALNQKIQAQQAAEQQKY